MLVVGPRGVGMGEGMGGSGDTATLLVDVMGTELLCLFAWKVHIFEGLDVFLPSIPLLSLNRYDPRRDGFRSKDVVSKAILGISNKSCCFWQQQYRHRRQQHNTRASSRNIPPTTATMIDMKTFLSKPTKGK